MSVKEERKWDGTVEEGREVVVKLQPLSWGQKSRDR